MNLRMNDVCLTPLAKDLNRVLDLWESAALSAVDQFFVGYFHEPDRLVQEERVSFTDFLFVTVEIAAAVAGVLVTPPASIVLAFGTLGGMKIADRVRDTMRQQDAEDAATALASKREYARRSAILVLKELRRTIRSRLWRKAGTGGLQANSQAFGNLLRSEFKRRFVIRKPGYWTLDSQDLATHILIEMLTRAARNGGWQGRATYGSLATAVLLAEVIEEVTEKADSDVVRIEVASRCGLRRTLNGHVVTHLRNGRIRDSIRRGGTDTLHPNTRSLLVERSRITRVETRDGRHFRIKWNRISNVRYCDGPDGRKRGVEFEILPEGR